RGQGVGQGSRSGRRGVRGTLRMPTPAPDVTTLLRLAVADDPQAKQDLFRLVEGELRRRARRYLRRQPPPHTLQTTVLVDEAFVQLPGQPAPPWESRRQFYCCAATVMRHVLVDYVRRRTAERRGGGERPAELSRLPEPVDPKAWDPLRLLALHEALAKL